MAGSPFRADIPLQPVYNNFTNEFTEIRWYEKQISPNNFNAETNALASSAQCSCRHTGQRLPVFCRRQFHQRNTDSGFDEISA